MPGAPDAQELQVLSICAFVSGSMLMAPGERIAGSVAYVLSAALFLWHRLRLRAEATPARPAADSAADRAPDAPP
jgi:hypothetical protein